MHSQIIPGRPRRKWTLVCFITVQSLSPKQTHTCTTRQTTAADVGETFMPLNKYTSCYAANDVNTHLLPWLWPCPGASKHTHTGAGLPSFLLQQLASAASSGRGDNEKASRSESGLQPSDSLQSQAFHYGFSFRESHQSPATGWHSLMSWELEEQRDWQRTGAALTAWALSQNSYWKVDTLRPKHEEVSFSVQN